MVEFGTSAELGKSQEVYIKEHNGYYKLKLLKKVIYDLNNENLESSVLLAKNIYDFNHHISFARVLCHLIYSAFISKVLDASLLIKFLNSNEWCEKGLSKNKSAMIRDFSRFLLNINSEESNYLIGIMLEQNLINTKIIKERKTLYFSHYKSEEDIKNSKYYEFSQTFFENIDELKRNDWELHKKYVKEGINQSEITKIIRNDEIEKLQEISSQANFDFNQTIEPSLYERCSYINHNNVTLIDYAAFFSAVKCFKFLLLNGSNINETGKYAVAGGNEEIIHLCIQNHSTFEDAYEAAILFHRNNIFKYLYDNKIIETIDLCTLGVKCIQYDNYEILSFLESEGMNMNYKLIDETAKIGNIYLLKYFLKKIEYIIQHYQNLLNQET